MFVSDVPEQDATALIAPGGTDEMEGVVDPEVTVVAGAEVEAVVDVVVDEVVDGLSNEASSWLRAALWTCGGTSVDSYETNEGISAHTQKT